MVGQGRRLWSASIALKMRNYRWKSPAMDSADGVGEEPDSLSENAVLEIDFGWRTGARRLRSALGNLKSLLRGNQPVADERRRPAVR